MAVLAFDERNVIFMRLAAMAEAEARQERMGLGDFIDAFEKAATIGEGESLAALVRALGGKPHILRGPPMAALESEAPAGRRPFLEYLERHDAVPGVNLTKPRTVMMVVVMPLLCHELIASRAPKHPKRDADDDGGGDELKIGLDRLAIEVLPEILAAERHHPYHGRVRERGREAEQNRLRDSASDGDDECRHHGLGMAGLEAVQGAEQDRGRHEEPGMGRALLEKIGKRRHRKPF
jgi:hypothetical protein